MNYIEQAAVLIRHHVPASTFAQEASDELFCAYAALMYNQRGRVSAEQVHNVWAAWATRALPGSPDIRPFAALDASTRAEDNPFVGAIAAAWGELGWPTRVA